MYKVFHIKEVTNEIVIEKKHIKITIPKNKELRDHEFHKFYSN